MKLPRINFNLKPSTTRKLNMTKMKFIKHKPTIYIVGGTACMLISTVTACYATTKVKDVIDDSKRQLNDTKLAVEHPEVLKDGMEYTPEDAKEDAKIIMVKTGFKIAKLYAPSIILAGVGIAGILTGNKIMRERNLYLSASLAAVTKEYSKYRERVADRYGADEEYKIRYNIVDEQNTEVVEENGKKKKVKVNKENAIDPTKYSIFSKVYDAAIPGWSKDPEENLRTLKQIEQWANFKLQTEGVLILNDVYKAIGFEKTKAAHIAGWIYGVEGCPEYVSFGIFEPNNPSANRFVNGLEANIILDFNCVENIWQYMN